MNLLHHRPPILRAGRPQGEAEAAAEAERAEGEQLVRARRHHRPLGEQPVLVGLAAALGALGTHHVRVERQVAVREGQTAEGAFALEAHPQGDGDPRRRPRPAGVADDRLGVGLRVGIREAEDGGALVLRTLHRPALPLREVEVLGRPRAEAPRRADEFERHRQPLHARFEGGLRRRGADERVLGPATIVAGTMSSLNWQAARRPPAAAPMPSRAIVSLPNSMSTVAPPPAGLLDGTMSAGTVAAYRKGWAADAAKVLLAVESELDESRHVRFKVVLRHARVARRRHARQRAAPRGTGSAARRSRRRPSASAALPRAAPVR